VKHNIRAKISLNNDCDIESKSKQKRNYVKKIQSRMMYEVELEN